MCAIDSEAALTDRTVRNLHRSDRNITKKADQILDIIETDRHASYQDIDALAISNQTVWNHLKKAGYLKSLDVWVPHELTM